MELMLDHGVDPGIRAEPEGETALHIAAYVGNPRLVEVLIGRGAPVNVTDHYYGTPPFVWALHAFLVDRPGSGAELKEYAHMSTEDRYRAVLAMLAGGDAEIDPTWVSEERLRASPDWLRALIRRGLA